MLVLLVQLSPVSDTGDCLYVIEIHVKSGSDAECRPVRSDGQVLFDRLLLQSGLLAAWHSMLAERILPQAKCVRLG